MHDVIGPARCRVHSWHLRVICDLISCLAVERDALFLAIVVGLVALRIRRGLAQSKAYDC